MHGMPTLRGVQLVGIGAPWAAALSGQARDRAVLAFWARNRARFPAQPTSGETLAQWFQHAHWESARDGPG